MGTFPGYYYAAKFSGNNFFFPVFLRKKVVDEKSLRTIYVNITISNHYAAILAQKMRNYHKTTSNLYIYKFQQVVGHISEAKLQSYHFLPQKTKKEKKWGFKRYS